MCRYVVEDLLVSYLWDRTEDGFWGGLNDSLRGSAIRTRLHSVGDPEPAGIANLPSSRILVLKTHSLILFPSATIEQVLHLESYVALQVS